MARVKKDEIVVGLDIGTTKIAAIVGEVTEEGIDVIGIGTARSRGLRKGVVINIDATVHDIQQAIREAEHMAGCDISTVYAGIAGGHIRGLNSHGIVAVKDKEVRDALAAAAAYAGKPERPPLGEVHDDAHRGITLYTRRPVIALRLGRPDGAAELSRRLAVFDATWAALAPAERAALSAIHLDRDGTPVRVTVAFSEPR